MNKKELRRDIELFDVSDVTWDIPHSKNRNQITVVLKSETPFNLIRTYLAFKSMCEKIETQLGILDEAEGEH